MSVTVTGGSAFGIVNEWLGVSTPVRLTGIYFATTLTDSVTGKGQTTQSAKLTITGVAQQNAQGSALYTSGGGVLKGSLVVMDKEYVPLDLVLNPADGTMQVVATQYFTNLLADAVFTAHAIIYYEDL
jgi:uncharacterized lipoprotein NlpE involved in copper resistance